MRVGAAGVLGAPVGVDGLLHHLDRLQQSERQEPETVAPGAHGRRLTGGGQPGRRMGVLERLGRLHALGHLQQLAVPAETLLLPHLDDDLDRFAPLPPGPVVGGDMKRQLLHRRGTPRTPLDPAVTQDVDGRHLLGHPGRVLEPRRHERHAEAEAEVAGRQRQSSEHHLVGRAGRPTVAEMVLHAPHGLEAERVGQLDLLDALVVGRLFGLPLPVGMRLVPRLDLGLELVEQIELHATSFAMWKEYL